MNWQIKKLKHLGQVISGGTPSTKNNEFWDGSISWITPGDLSHYHKKFISSGRRNISQKGLENSAARLIPKGSVLFSSRAPVGYVVVAQNELTTNQGFKTLIPSEEVYNEFLYYYLKYARTQVDKHTSGTTFKEISASGFGNIEVFVPQIEEQHRIVAKIEELFSELDNGVANLEKTREQLQTYRQSVLKHAFEGRLTENWRAHNPDQSNYAFTEETGHKAAEPQAVYQQTAQATASNDISQETLENLPGPELIEYIKAERQRQYEQELKEWEQKAKAAKAKGQKKPAKPKKPKEMDPLTEEELQQLPELPEGWCWVKLGDISYLITKGASPKWQGFNYTQDNSQTLFITSENVRENFLDISNPKFLENSFNDKQKNSVLRKYDLLINIVGASIGRASVFKLNSLANINQAVSKVSLVNHEMAEFYSLYFNSKIANDIFNLKKVDVARANLSLHDINNIPVPLSSIKEQKQIVREIESRLSVADNLSESIDQSLQQAQSMRQSILKKAFEGKLVENEEEVEAEKA